MRFQSQVYVIARGSVGGVTYSANQFHQLIARAKTSPVNPSTGRQAMIRGAFSDASALFENLVQADKDRWQNYAETVEYQGPLGPYQPTGRNLCIANVSNALYLDDRGISIGTPDAAPPLAPGLLSLADLDVGALATAGTGFSVSFRNNNAEAVVVSISRSIAFSTARNRFKGPFGIDLFGSASIPAGNGLDVDVPGLNDGSVYFAVVRASSADSPYRLSPQYFVRAVAEVTGP